jgi:hypothetical protein
VIDERYLLRLALLYHLDRRIIVKSTPNAVFAERWDRNAYSRRATPAYRHLCQDLRQHPCDAVIVWQRTLRGEVSA